MAPDVVCAGRSFDVPLSVLGKQGITLAGNISSEAFQPLRLHLVEDVTRVLANRWAFLRHRNAGGHLQQRSKIFPHYCAYGKAHTVWPVQRCKGRFLSFLFGQTVISWLHLIFMRFWNSLWAVFPSSWQDAPGSVIPCDTYIAHQDCDSVFWSPALLTVMPCSLAEASGWARAWGTARNPGHLGVFRACVGRGKERSWGWEAHGAGRAGWFNFSWRSGNEEERAASTLASEAIARLY